MVSTVTVSTITLIAISGITAGMAIFATILLAGLLITKELLGASSANRNRYIARACSISIIPLLLGFAVIVGIKVTEILA